MSDTRIKTAIGPTILLQSGAYFDLLDPHGSMFTIEDIAHGLAHTCRFAGQCSSYYSVAEHSWHASHLVDPAIAFATLMHDAAEAFIGDVTRPLKSLLPDYKEVERWIEHAIAERFDLPMLGNDAEGIKRADLLMLHAEQDAMMPAHDDSWSTAAGLGEPLRIDFKYWSPPAAKDAFLSRYFQVAEGRP